jgi:hypothetical protein
LTLKGPRRMELLDLKGPDSNTGHICVVVLSYILGAREGLKGKPV